MAKLDIGGVDEEDQLPDWMSQLFEKLDLEANMDDDLTDKVAQGETHPLVEGGISSEIHRSSKEKDSTMDVGGLHGDQSSSDWISLLFGKSGLETNEDSICSTGKVDQEEIPPLVEGGIFSEIHRSSEVKDSTMAKVKKGGLLDEDEYTDWLIEILKKDGHGDVLSHYNLDKEEKQKKETIKNGMKWMSEECFLAFTKHAEKINLKGIKYKFEQRTTSELYFAEVKQLSGVKSYFCCPLDRNDEGNCYGCKNQDMYDLKHPSTRGYEEGDADICWPFIDGTASDSDGDDDCGGLGC